MSNRGKITITKKEYQDLLDTQAHMDMLEGMGVDNWGGWIGRYQDCDECGKGDISWAEDKCPKCGEELPETYDY